jgi:HPt (histidine-containing phosphotransfer) domain-containing protein
MNAPSISFETVEDLYTGHTEALSNLLGVASNEFSKYHSGLQGIDFEKQTEDLRFFLHKIKGITATFHLQNLQSLIQQIQLELQSHHTEKLNSYKLHLLKEIDLVMRALQEKQNSLAL